MRAAAWAFTTVAALICVLCTTTAATAGGGTGRPAAGRDGPGLTIFRIDVSKYPQVGIVVTVPGTPRGLAAADFSIMSGGRASRPWARQLSPDDIELVLAPDASLRTTELRPEQAASARFLVSLPTGAQTGVVNPYRPVQRAVGLSGDPTAGAAQVATLGGQASSSPATRLGAALAAFSRGASVRRTVVLVVSSDPRLRPALATRFRQQLAASGTALYVLDATAGGAPAYDALATASGGLAARIRAPGTWTAAFGQIAAQLGEQYYLKFTDPAPLPGQVSVLVSTPRTVLRSVADLPVANPVAPPPLPAPALALPAQPAVWDRPLGWLAALLIIFGISYGLAMFAASRRDPAHRPHRPGGPALAPGGPNGARPGQAVLNGADGARPGQAALDLPAGHAGLDAPDDLYFVFLMPCLNEEKVILNSLSRLLAMPGDNFVILVIDDGSDDNTAAVVSTVAGDRVWLYSRKLPQARQGKGEALNAAVRYLSDSDQLAGRDPDSIIVVIVDADGQLDPHAVNEVSPFFADPTIGAVQIGVRINNRERSSLARMQDMEFVIYTEVFQRGRRFLGSVGLGGNGQFMRLSALQSLGPAPWTRSLTDDLDLGVRLLTNGWRNEYCSAAAVHQQGIVQFRRLVRQRSRWFQGHLQSWKLIPSVLRSAPRRSRGDLFYHLSSPAILLIASLLTTSFVLSLADCVLLAAEGRNPLGWWVLSSYALTFGPALCYSYVYWRRERASGVRLLRVAGLAHLYVCYGMMWYASGWWAVGRTLRGRTGWAKTERVTEAPLAVPLPANPVVLAGAPAPRAPALVTAAAGTSEPRMAGPPRMDPVTQPIRSVTGLPGDRWPLPPFGEDPITEPIPVVSLNGGPDETVLGDQPAGPPPVTSAPSPVTSAPPPAGPSQVTSAPSPAGPPPVTSRAARPRRRRFAAAALAAVLTVAAFGVVTIAPRVGQAGQRQWLTVFNGYGTVSVTGYREQPVITLLPQRARTRTATHSALVVSAHHYRDFVATLLVRTMRQLRRGRAGGPRPWEVGWVVWHYTSDQHFYALTLESDGWALSKQDPRYPGGERFLASGRTPAFRIGVSHRVGIVQIGNLITVSADGHLLARFTDTQRPLLAGAFGLYCEDSDVRFSDIKVTELPGPARGLGLVSAWHVPRQPLNRHDRPVRTDTHATLSDRPDHGPARPGGPENYGDLRH